MVQSQPLTEVPTELWRDDFVVWVAQGERSAAIVPARNRFAAREQEPDKVEGVAEELPTVGGEDMAVGVAVARVCELGADSCVDPEGNAVDYAGVVEDLVDRCGLLCCCFGGGGGWWGG